MTHAPRVAHAGDVPEILRLGEAMYATIDIRVDSVWREVASSQFATRLGADLRGWVIDDADRSGTLVACGFLNLTPRLPFPGDTSGVRGQVQWVVTDPDHRGQGLARSIMGVILDWAVNDGITIVELMSSPMARPLYESLGFRGSPNIHYPPEVLGIPMQWRVERSGLGSARPS